MRTEATIEEWRRLYDLSDRFYKLKPWELLDNLELVMIRFSEDDYATFSVMGNGGQEYGFSLYEGDNALRELYLYLKAASLGMDNDPDSAMFLQNCVSMFMDTRDLVSKEQLAIIKKLGRKYGAGRKWVHFQDYARGYIPYIPDGQGVRQTTRCLEKLLEAFPLIEKIKPRGMHIVDHVYQYALDGDLWQLSVAQVDRDEMAKLWISAENEGLRKAAAAWPKLKESWEIGLMSAGYSIDDKKYDRPLFPFILVAVDHKTGYALSQELLSPDKGPQEICGIVTSWMQQAGRPKELLVSGQVMAEILSAAGEITGIPVRITVLSRFNEFREAFRKEFGTKTGSSDPERLVHEMIEQLSGGDTEGFLGMLGMSSEEELMKTLYENVLSGHGGFPGLGEDFFDDPFDFDDLYESDDLEVSPVQEYSTMNQKLMAVKDFYEFTYRPGDEDADWEDDDKAEGVIYVSWVGDWRPVLSACRKPVLQEMAGGLGITVSGSKKDALTEKIAHELMSKPGRVREILSEEERKLLRDLRNYANKDIGCMSEEFPYAREVIEGLVKKGIVDVKTQHDMFTEYLLLEIPAKLRGKHL